MPRLSVYPERVEAELRAWAIVGRLFDKLSFTRIYNGTEVAWVKKVDGKMLSITEKGVVSMGSNSICIVAQNGHGQVLDMPFGDMVVSKILTLCTKRRRDITTLNKECQSILDVLLPIKEVQPILVETIKEVKGVQSQKEA